MYLRLFYNLKINPDQYFTSLTLQDNFDKSIDPFENTF